MGVYCRSFYFIQMSWSTMGIRKKTYIGLFIGMCIILIFYIMIPRHTSLLFYKENTNEIAAYLPIEKGQTFQIIFVHSIHLTDVVEKYEITTDEQIKQYEIVFEEFGIGMPSTVGEGETFVYENGKYHLKNMNHTFSSMNIRNGKTVSEHRLVWKDMDGEEHLVYFNDYFEPGAWFTVKVGRLSLLQTWKEVKIRE